MLTRAHHRRGRALDTIIYVFLMAVLSGCGLLRPRIIERVHHDTTTVNLRDSILLRDSIYIREWMKGDTVFVDRYRDRYLYRDRWRDSIIVKHDSLTVETTKEVKVEKPLSAWQKFRIGGFWWLLALAAIGWRKQLIWLIRKAASLFG